MKQTLVLLVSFALGCGGTETTAPPPDVAGDTVDTSLDTGPNACVAAGGKCALDAQGFKCAAFGPYWEEVTPADKLYGSCGSSGTPDGTAIPTIVYPCCMGVFGDAGGDADASDSNDATDAADASFKLAGCGVTCSSSEVCQYPYPPGICPGGDSGICPPGCPGCPSLPPPSCKPMPSACASAPTCDCLVKNLCTSFGGSCEKHPSEFVVSCMSG